jgi:hypothetical protein
LKIARVLPTDITSPTILSVSPENGTTDVPVHPVITATFSEPMDESTINTNSFTLADNEGFISGTVTYDGETFTAFFTPDTNLIYNTTYTAMLSTEIKDLVGNPLAKPYTWSLTTIAQNAQVQGETWEVKGIVLPGVTLTLDGDTFVVSDENGNYQLLAYTTGWHTVVANKVGFRSQTETINVDNLETVYTLDFEANTGLIPNAPDMSYVLACIHIWKYPHDGLGLDISSVLAVIHAWKFPVVE